MTTHDAGEANGQLYLAMELVDGVDLSHVVRSQASVTIADACELVRQAAIRLQADPRA